jgi:hypothetical protein
VRLNQLDEERRRICTALGLKASIYSDGRVEIAGHPAGGSHKRPGFRVLLDPDGATMTVRLIA